MIGLLPTMGLAETAKKVDIDNDTRTIYFLDGTSKNLGEVIESLNILFSNDTNSTILKILNNNGPASSLQVEEGINIDRRHNDSQIQVEASKGGYSSLSVGNGISAKGQRASTIDVYAHITGFPITVFTVGGDASLFAEQKRQTFLLLRIMALFLSRSAGTFS